MKHSIDYLIIGQGIAGTLLSQQLLQSGRSVLVFDRDQPRHTASRVAGAVINPFSGKHWKPKNPEWITEAQNTYLQLGEIVQQDFLSERQLYLFPEQQVSSEVFNHLPDAFSDHLSPYFNSSDGVKVVPQLWQINAELLLDSWRQHLKAHNAFREEIFDKNLLSTTEKHLRYKGLEVGALIFCDGAEGATNSWFPNLPFTSNRGEALVVSIPGLPTSAIYQKGIRLIPLKGDLFWCGSNYRWNFSDLKPDEAWRNTVLQSLEQWLRLPFSCVDHWVALRPTTAGQRPLLLQSAAHEHIFMFNGLGTQGFSAGPFLAKQMATALLSNTFPL